MLAPFCNYSTPSAVDYLVVNYVNKFFDELFIIVHDNLSEKELSQQVKSESKECFEKIKEILYKTDDESTKYETMHLIWRRSYLLRELITKKSSICDFEFNCEAYELFWFSDELLELYEATLSDHYLMD